MSVLTSQRIRRKKYLFSRLVRIFFGIALIFGIILGAALLSYRPIFQRSGEPLGSLVEPGGARTVSLNTVQERLEALDWVRQDLLPVNDYSRPGTALKKVNAIVVHYVGNPGTTATQNRSYYNRLAESGETSASSTFLVGMDGEILECVPVNEVAYCSNWRNEDTLSIECCHPDETGEFTEDTYEALVRLTAWLCNELRLNTADIIRHYDVTGKECPKYFVDHEDAWEAFKGDVQAALEELMATPSEQDGSGD